MIGLPKEAVCLGMLLLAVTASAQNVSSQTLSLFDGKSFEGWEGDIGGMFRIEDGAIVAGSLERDIPRNEFLCTEREYGDLELRLKFKVIGEQTNAGIQFRTRRIPNHHEVIGYQADLGNPGWWGSLYDESRRRKVLAKSDMGELGKVLRRGDWNEYVIRAEGRRIQLWINGYRTVDYMEPDECVEQSGVICLQIHSGPSGEARYRDIAIQELP